MGVYCLWLVKHQVHYVVMLLMFLMLSNTADLIDGIQMGDGAAKSSPASEDDDCSEDTETTTEPAENGGSPTSESYRTDVFEENVPKYTDVQVDEVRKYDFDSCLTSE